MYVLKEDPVPVCRKGNQFFVITCIINIY